MLIYNNKYRGMNIHIEYVSDGRVEYRVEKSDKSIVEDSEGFCVTVDDAMGECKELIDDILN